MENKVFGLHHITAIANDAKRNYDFYAKTLGLRLVKKTVNFDDPGTYHFYFGDEIGTPGTILTFFPWEGIGQGKNGTGMATHIGYSIPKGSLSFWEERLKQNNLRVERKSIFGKDVLSFQDMDGLELEFSEADPTDKRIGWETDEIEKSKAVIGFQYVTLTLKSIEATARILTEVLGYEFSEKEGNRHRYITKSIEVANIVDILEEPTMPHGYNAAGTNHHIAFRVNNEETLMAYRQKVIDAGLDITPKINRDYFFSLYFREPGGVLFELATENPGFTVDEKKEDLGSELKLPTRYETMRKELLEILPKI